MTRAMLGHHMKSSHLCHRQLMVIAMRITRNQAIAEDLVQEVAAAMSAKSDQKLAEIYKPFRYYVGVLNHKANDWLKRTISWRQDFKEYCEQIAPSDRRNGKFICEQPEARNDEFDVCGFLKEFVWSRLESSLQDEDRSFLNAFLGIALPGKTSNRLRAVADSLGCSIGSARSRFHRIIQKASELGNLGDARPPPERAQFTTCLSWCVVGFKLTQTLSRRTAMEVQVQFLELRGWSVTALRGSLPTV